MSPVKAARNVQRPGYTLLEILVVVTVIMILAGMVMAFLPKMQEQQRAYRGADMVQGAMLAAKARALRDQRPTGIRLVRDTTGTNANWVKEIHFIQQPEDYAIGSLVSAQGTSAQFTGANFTGGLPPNLAPVQRGDYLEINRGGLVHQIVAVGGNNLTLASPIPNPVPRGGNYTYRVMRTPRLLAGESPVLLPQDIAVDLTLSGSMNITARRPSPLPLQQPTQNPEILFSPAGSMMFRNMQPSDLVVLWVRDISFPTQPTVNSPALICVQCRTGAIEAHPVNVYGGDFYSYCRDNRTSGM